MMRKGGAVRLQRWLSSALLIACTWLLLSSVSLAQQSSPDLLTLSGEPGQRGGRIVLALRAEPKTLNPLSAADAPSREAISTMQADLIHINRSTQLTEPA